MLVAVSLVAVVLCSAALFAGDEPKAAATEPAKEKVVAAKDTTEVVKHDYVGVGKCKMCHMPYFKAWSETGHAKAFDLLNAEKKEDKDKKCLKCHTTGMGQGGYDAAKETPDFKGVQCEACHGAGADYLKMSVMKDPKAAKAAGLVSPVTEEVCVKCHNKESPTFKGFDFEKFKAKGIHTVKKETKK